MAYEIYTLGVPLDWPKRLLHIPSLTSQVWEEGNQYGHDKEPQYAILSYTWGRYEIDNGPHLDIKGIDWEVPSINPDHFTVAAFINLLEQISRSYQYVWLDVACIDQKREKVKMDEVGRQGIIFKRAKKAFIWLNKFEPDVVQSYMQKLMSCGYEFAIGNIDPFLAAQKMVNALSSILKDPWFSSLWTLQESFLHRHATMLNKKGEPIITDGPWIGESPECQLLDISGACSVARAAIGEAMKLGKVTQEDDSLSSQVQDPKSLLRVIDDSGLDFMLCPNPNIQYAAARFRKTTRSEDRIYAIMQAYGYRLGNSAPSTRSLQRFGLEELELQFLTTLNSQSLVLGQAFQHLAEPAAGQSWCITNHIRVPPRLQMIIVHETFLATTCRIKIHSKAEAYFRGDSVEFSDLGEFWNARSQAHITATEKRLPAIGGLQERNEHLRGLHRSRNYLFKAAKQGMIIDHTDALDATALSYEWPPDTMTLDDTSEAIIENRIPELTEAVKRQKSTFASLTARFGETNLRVLYLGRTKHVESMEMTLILVRKGSIRKGLTMHKVPIWRRIGIAFWNIEGDRGLDLTSKFEVMEGKFG